MEGDSIVLEEEIDPNYEPTEKEVLEYATWLGMDLEAERDLFWIAREGLKAPLPENWKPCKTTDTEEIYYFNFASGQSTWDHPCDEFYRNLYEEHKNKRQSSVQESDDKKKAKEDVAELLGRKSGGKKKKKGALAKADPLGPTTLGKANPLEKKPLPGLSGRLGSLGSSSGGLNPVVGLGPLRSEAKDFGGSGIRHDAASDDFKREDMFKPLSKNPLKSVQGKKTLLSASPSMLSKDDTDQSPHVASANFDQQREKLDQEHADKLREIQNEHEIELEALRKKMKVQLDDLQDAEEMKLKQLRRELDKKKHDLENQFDLEENALQRSRKDQLRRIETENEQALDRKKQELDSDFRSETEKLRQMHEEKQRRLQEELDQEAKQISERLQASLGEKKDAADLALELNTEIERLRKEQTKHGEELGAIRSESTTLLHGKSAAEAERDKIQLEVDELRRQLSITRESDTVASAPLECTQCPLWEDRVSSVEVERDIAQEEREKLRNELIFLKRESEARADAAREKVDVMTKASSEKDCEIQALREQEAQLKREMTKLQQRLAALEVESNDLRVKCALLQEVQSSTDPSNQTVPASAIVSEEQLNALESQLAAAKAEVANTKDELSDLQDRYAVTTTTNAQIKEQLMKESNEKKALQERLDLRTEEASQKADVEANKHRQQLEHLQHQLETESQARKKQEDEVNYLRKELQDLKLAKREAEAGLGQLEGDTRQEELYAAEHSEMAKRILELESEVGRLQTKVDNLEKQLSTSRSEKEDLAKDKASVEVELGNVRHMMERLQRQLSVERVLDVSVEGHRKCMKCPALKDQISSLESECTGARSEMEKVRGNFTHLQQEFKDRMAAEREKADLEVVNLRREKESEAQVFAEQEVLLKREISTLRQRLTTIETESSELRAQCAFLQSAKEAATQNQAAASSSATVIQEQINVVERQLTTAKAEVISTKSELRTLQDQYAEISTANSLIKEQLVRESDEKNTLRKKLELKGEEIAHSLSVEVSKHRQRLEELQHQLERETQARRDREDACDVLRKELQTAEQGKRKAEAELGQLESDKRHLVSEKSMLKLRLDEMNMSRQREESSAVSAEEALASKKLEVERLRSNLRLAGEDKDHLEARIKVLNQEYEQLQSKAHRLEEEYENERLRCRTIEKDRDSASQRQQSLADDLENSQRKSSSLAAEVLELQGLLSKAKSNEQATTSKADQVTKKLHELEQRKEREDFSMKMKLQQVEVELQNIVHNKERAEMQLQSREKELKAAKDEIARMGSEIESLETRIKAILIDKEEAHAALLNASVATATTASPRHTSSKPLDPAVDVMLVKLQLANTNRNELEIHLADISAQLEDSTRRCASLEGRCRDQSLEIELLHVEVSSLRSASLKMHVSALDSLALVERLEYEHKKRALRSDFLIQLRDFKEREEEALVRHKARLRARYERHLDELVADLEKMRQERVEQEEAQTAQMLERIRQERDAKRNDAEQKVREELNLFEQELHERKAREIGIITKAIEKEEEELGARLRELHQAVREEELTKQMSEQENATGLQREHRDPVSPRQLDNHPSTQRHTQLVGGDVNGSLSGPTQMSGIQKLSNNQLRDSHRDDRRQLKNMKTYHKWKKRLQDEDNLLTNVRALVSNQRRGLLKQALQLKSSKNEWKRNSRTDESNPIQREGKRMLDENMTNWSEGMKKLREQEAWVKQRERQLAKMRRTVQRLRSKCKEPYERDNNLSESSSGEDEESRDSLSDDSNQSEFITTLEKLEQLEQELTLPAGNFSEELYPDVEDRVHAYSTRGAPRWYPAPREIVHRYPQTGVFASRRAIHSAGDSSSQDQRWGIRSQRTAFGLRGDRFPVAPMANASNRTDQVYQQKISRWAQGREKVQHAATNHATWLSGLCEELREYGAKYSPHGQLTGTQAAELIHPEDG